MLGRASTRGNLGVDMDANMLRQLVEGLGPRMQSESQVVAELYHQLRSRIGLSPEHILLEAPYPHDAVLKCDMVIRAAGAPEVWIEVKGYFSTESPSTRSRKHTAEQSSPYQSCGKLCGLPSGSYRAMIVYRNVEFEPIGGNSWESLEARCQRDGILLLHRTCSVSAGGSSAH